MAGPAPRRHQILYNTTNINVARTASDQAWKYQGMLFCLMVIALSTVRARQEFVSKFAQARPGALIWIKHGAAKENGRRDLTRRPEIALILAG